MIWSVFFSFFDNQNYLFLKLECAGGKCISCMRMCMLPHGDSTHNDACVCTAKQGRGALSPEIEGGKGAVGITARSTPSGSRVSRFPHRLVLQGSMCGAR
jgi:hypothetical protein